MARFGDNAKILESISFEDEFWRKYALRFFHPDFNRRSGILTLSAKWLADLWPRWTLHRR